MVYKKWDENVAVVQEERLWSLQIQLLGHHELLVSEVRGHDEIHDYTIEVSLKMKKGIVEAFMVG